MRTGTSSWTTWWWASIIRWMVGQHPPQRVPAVQALATSATVVAPFSIEAWMTLADTARQEQTIIVAYPGTAL